MSRVSNLNLETFNVDGVFRVQFLQLGDLPLGESEIHADVCRIQGFLKGCSIF